MMTKWCKTASPRQIRKYFGRNIVDMYVDLFHRKVKGQPYFAELTLHCIIGQMPSVKKMRIRFGDNEIDLRISGCVFKPSGSDSGYGIDFMSSIAKAIGINYEAITKTDNIINLIGLSTESQGYDPKQKKTMKIIKPNRGILDPTIEDDREITHIICVNNAEVLINSTAKNIKLIMGCYEKAIKTIGTDGNKVISEWHKRPSKNPTEGNFKNRIEFYPDCSLMFISQPPDNFLKTIDKCPMLQSMIVLYNEYSTKNRVRVAKEYTRLLGVDDSTEDDLKDLIRRLKHVDKYWGKHWKDKITIEPDAITKIEAIIGRIFSKVNKVDETQRDSLESFAQHWIEQVWRIAWHRMILRLDTTVKKGDVEFAEMFLWPVWKQLINMFLEDVHQPKNKRQDDRRRLVVAMRLYQDNCRKSHIAFGSPIPRAEFVKTLAGVEHWDMKLFMAKRQMEGMIADGWFECSMDRGLHLVSVRKLPPWLKKRLKNTEI